MPSCAVDDIEVHYEEGGEGPPLLLLNGLVASAFLWPSAWLDRLERDHRVVRVSNRGTGHTPPGDEVTVPGMAADAAAVLDHLGIDRAGILGFSMGGMVAQALALGAPERVGALVLVSTTTGGAVDVHPEFVAAISGSGGDTVSAAGAFFHLLTGPGFFEENPASLGELAEGWQQAPTPPDTAVLQLTAAGMFDSRDRLHEISAPTMVLHGIEDRLLMPAGGERLAAGITGATLHTFEGVGHMLPFETASHTAEMVAAFLA